MAPDVGQQATEFAQRVETLLQNVLGPQRSDRPGVLVKY